MKAMDRFIIDLKHLEKGVYNYHFSMTDEDFEKIGGSEFQKGDVEVDVEMRVSSGDSFSFDFEIDGTVIVPCDRCLEDMELEISTDGHFDAKFGDGESDDELVFISEIDQKIDLSWHIYEFIALAIPIRHVHEDGECDEAMAEKFRSHECFESGEDDEDSESADLASNTAAGEKEIDPRWEALKNFKIK